MKLFRKTLAGALALVMAAGIVTALPAEADAADKLDAGKTGIVRLGGTDRFDTAGKISAEGWDKAETVVIANAYSYADALAGSPLAYALDAPILLTNKEYVTRGVSDVITGLGAKKAVILGGTAAVSSDVEKMLKDSGLEVSRIAGQTRYETAEKIAEALRKATGKLSEAFIASGVNYPDALSASSAAALKNAPILYSPADGKLETDTVTFIRTAGIKNAYILGGTAAVGAAADTAVKSAGVEGVTRLGGSDRYETSLRIAKQFDKEFKSDDIAFATGKNFPDALAGSVLAAKKSVPVLLTDNSEVREDVKEYVDSRTRSKVYVFGGTTVVSDSIINSYISKNAEEIKAGASVENGGLVIRIAVSGIDLAWSADEMAQDSSVLKYEGSETKDGFYTARYSVAGDGRMAVCARHYYSNTICDELHSWDVTVKDGKITDISAETVKKSPAESEQDSRLSGSWIEDKTQYTAMTVSKNESKGWNVEVSAPMTRGAYVFKATVYYDCESDVFAYNKGKFFDLNTDGTYNTEAAVAGAEGYFRLGGTDKAPELVWHSSDDRAKNYISADITYVPFEDDTGKGRIEDGNFVIEIPVSENGIDWAADEMAQDDSVLKFAGSEVKDGYFTARYTPAGNGTVTVSARHYYSNNICDELHSWDVTVKDGKVTNISEETVKKSPDESEQDAVLSGDWEEYQIKFTEMTISKNEGKGWNVEITSPVSRGAYIFKATVYYDCEMDRFAYNKGKFFDIPINGKGSLGEAKIMGATGYLKLSGTGKDARLAWHSDAENNSDIIDIIFERVDPNDVDISKYVGDYIWDRCSVKVRAADNTNELAFEVKWGSGAYSTTVWNMSGIIDPVSEKVAYTNSRKVTHNYDSSGNDIPVLHYENGTGSFEFDEKNLLWNDDKDESAKGKVFSLIGSDDYTDRYDEAVKDAVEQYLRSGNLNAIEEIIFNIVNILSEEEISANPVFKEYKLGENDLVFDVSYDIKVVKGVDTINYSIPNGEVDGQWVKNISRVGVVRYADGKYSVDPKFFGTGI